MKTPMQELIEQLNNVKPQDFCSIETIKEWAKKMLKKEKEVMCEFAFRFNHDAFNENYIKAEFEETFKTKEK